MNRSIGAAFLLLLASSLCLAPAGAAEPPSVRVVTNLGEFVIELDPERAPLTVANFLRYVREGHYSGTIFHRVIANFVAQGGGYAQDMKPKPTHDAIPNESGNGLLNVRGAVGLARASGPHTGDAQFYLNLSDNADLNPLPTRWGYAVFGHVTEGMDVVDRIGLTATGAVGPFKGDAPVKPVVIQRIELVGAATQGAPAAPAPAGPVPAAPATAAPPPPGAPAAAPPAAPASPPVAPAPPPAAP